MFLLFVCLFWVVNWIWSRINFNLVYSTRLEYLEILFGALFPHLISFNWLQLESTNMITGIKLCMFQRNIYFWSEHKIHDYQNWKSLVDSLSFVAITGLAATKMKFSASVTSDQSRPITSAAMHILAFEDRSGLPFPQSQDRDIIYACWKAQWSWSCPRTLWRQDDGQSGPSRQKDMSFRLNGCSKKRLRVQRARWASTPARCVPPA